MLYSCVHITSVGVKGLILTSTDTDSHCIIALIAFGYLSCASGEIQASSVSSPRSVGVSHLHVQSNMWFDVVCCCSEVQYGKTASVNDIIEACRRNRVILKGIIASPLHSEEGILQTLNMKIRYQSKWFVGGACWCLLSSVLLGCLSNTWSSCHKFENFTNLMYLTFLFAEINYLPVVIPH